MYINESLSSLINPNSNYKKPNTELKQTTFKCKCIKWLQVKWENPTKCKTIMITKTHIAKCLNCTLLNDISRISYHN